MPLLKWNVDLFPASLFELPESDFPWWVAHVRSRQEKALARNLFPLEVPFYLPQREKRIRRAGRAFVSYIPLFPGYLFFRGSAAQRSAALRSNLIVKVLEVTDQGLLAQELLQIRRLQETGADLVPYHDLVPGDAVRVIDGSFKGYTGVVLRTRGRVRLLVSISMLRQAVAVEFEREVVAPIRVDSTNRMKDRSAAAS
jgi:transcription termination/antitermination protein NusG